MNCNNVERVLVYVLEALIILLNSQKIEYRMNKKKSNKSQQSNIRWNNSSFDMMSKPLDTLA